MENKTVDDTNDALIVATTKVCLLVIDVVTALGFLQWSSVERHYVQLLREATRPSATENPRPSNKNPGADEDFPLLYILYDRLRD